MRNDVPEIFLRLCRIVSIPVTWSYMSVVVPKTAIFGFHDSVWKLISRAVDFPGDWGVGSRSKTRA